MVNHFVLLKRKKIMIMFFCMLFLMLPVAGVADNNEFSPVSDIDFVVNEMLGVGECTVTVEVVVNSLDDIKADDDQCTLREAVESIQDSIQIITFDPSLINGLITLDSQISITDKSFTIDGGANNITISGDDTNRIFFVERTTIVGQEFTLKNLTLSDAYIEGVSGGAIRSEDTKVNLERVVIRDSVAESGGAIHHSGLFDSPLTILESTFEGNSAVSFGGALFLDGAADNPVSINNSTFVGNQASGSGSSIGGAIATENTALTVGNSTFTGNISAGLGGGIGDLQVDTDIMRTDFIISNSTFSDNVASGVGPNIGSNLYHISGVNGRFQLSNSILSGTPGQNCYTTRSPLDTNINNLIQDGSCNAELSGDPLLAPLADNGGFTETLALMAGSPALGAGSGCEVIDQRGYTRDAACDLGAFEVVECGAESYTVPLNDWQIISLPCDPGVTNNTVADVLGDDLTGAYGIDWGMYVFDASAGTEGEYSFLSSSSVLSPGVGYWLLALNEAGAWSMEMDDELNVEPFEIQLTAAHDGFSEQQNMVGNPSTNSMAWENTQVFDSSNNCYERPSVAATLEVGLIDNAINYYNGAGYTVCDDTGTNPPCEIAAGEGFWVNVTDDSETNLRLKIGGSSCTSSITFAGEDTIADQESIQSSDKTFDEALDQASVQVAPLGWAVYLKVNAGPYEDPVNTLGQRDTAVIGYDRNDLKELAPDRDPYLTLVFPHPDWGEKAGDYGADYQPLDRSQTSEWYFVIRTSELLQDLKLSWQGPVDILKDSKLVDMDTGETVMLKKLSSFSTEWYGLQERHFKWVLKKSKNKKKPISEELN